jgi:allantoinase
MNHLFDVVIRGGRVVTPEAITEADVGIAGGKIAKIGVDLGEAEKVIEAAGRFVFPGIIDAHVHFNEPGREEWEGLATGSAALAAGGATSFFDMPLNSEPPVLNAAALREKRARAEEKSCLDFAVWGGLTPCNLDQLAALRDAGAIGFKAFMCPSGIDSFPHADPATLREGLKRAAKLDMIVAVHAEDPELAARHTAAQRAKGKSNAAAWLASRPVEVELTAIRTALELAGETGCALHIVHVSSPEGLALIDEARLQRVDVTAETCPHYLLLNDRDVAKIGAPAKCAPPIRDEKRRIGLWEKLRAGQIQTIGSDHSPSPPELKTSPDFFENWGGIAGCQHGFQLLFSACAANADRELPLLAALLARNVARRFRLGHQKGLIAEGRDADLTVVEFGAEHEIQADDLWTRHRVSAYVGRKSRARVTHTLVRGGAVFANGRLVNFSAPGRFLRPVTG